MSEEDLAMGKNETNITKLTTDLMDDLDSPEHINDGLEAERLAKALSLWNGLPEQKYMLDTTNVLLARLADGFARTHQPENLGLIFDEMAKHTKNQSTERYLTACYRGSLWLTCGEQDRAYRSLLECFHLNEAYLKAQDPAVVDFFMKRYHGENVPVELLPIDEHLEETIDGWMQNDEYERTIKTLEAMREAAKEPLPLPIVVRLAVAYNGLALYKYADESEERQRNLEKALEVLESERERGEEDPLWQSRMGFALYSFAGREDEAVKHFRAWLRLQPRNIEAAAMLEEAQRFAKRLETVRRHQTQGDDRTQDVQDAKTWAENVAVESLFVTPLPPEDEKWHEDGLNEELVAKIEHDFGVVLPPAYIAFMRLWNGGLLKKNAYPTLIPLAQGHRWAEIAGLFSISDAKPYALMGDKGTGYFVNHKHFPPIGFVIGCNADETAGVMLSYRDCGPKGDPAVVFVDLRANPADPSIVQLADNFMAFIDGLTTREALRDGETETDRLGLVSTQMRAVRNLPLSNAMFAIIRESIDPLAVNYFLRNKLFEEINEQGELTLENPQQGKAAEVLDTVYWLYKNANPAAWPETFFNNFMDLMGEGNHLNVGLWNDAQLRQWMRAALEQGRLVQAGDLVNIAPETRQAIEEGLAGIVGRLPTELNDRLDQLFLDERHREIVEGIRFLPDSERTPELMGRAAANYNNLGEFQKSLYILQQLLAEYPNDSLSHYRYGYALLHEELQRAQTNDVPPSRAVLQKAHAEFMLALQLGVPPDIEADMKAFMDGIERSSAAIEQIEQRQSRALSPAMTIGTAGSSARPVRDEVIPESATDEMADRDEAVMHADVRKHIQAALRSMTERPIASDEDQLAVYTPQEREAFEQHILDNYGLIDGIFTETSSMDFKLDIFLVRPTKERPFYTLITCGMGAFKLNVPEQFKDYHWERCELMITLPRHWNIHSSEMHWYWPIALLKVIAHIPSASDSWITASHTVANDAPYDPSTALSAAAITLPQGFRDEATANKASRLTLPNGEVVNFYQVIPLYAEELQVAQEQGFATLFSLMQGVTHVIDPKRANVAVSPVKKGNA